jgi:predicted phosphate transport protein (TIGR00153 family)
MLKNLVPKNEAFFDLFDKICVGISEGAELLVKMVDSRHGFGEYAQKMKTIEHRTDQVVHSLMSRLHKTFVTPIDREEIHQLAGQLDDILDQIEAAASRMDLYCCDCLPPEVTQLANVIFESVKMVQEMVGLLRKLKKPDRILELTVEINRLEDQADYIRRSTVARLFREEKNYLELVKWKDILEYLERATDCCEDVANITEGIVLENT